MSSAETAPVEPSPSRAGRNLPVAVAVGVGLGALIIASLVFYKYLFAVLVTAAILVAVWEMYNAFLHNDIRIARSPLYVVVLVSPTLAYLFGVEAHMAVFGTFVVVALMWRIRRGTDGFVKDATGSLFVGFYLPFMVGFVMLMLRETDGIARIVAFIAITVCNDVGGYFAGVLFGKHPIAPQISPKKSWEGFSGSVILAVAVAIPLFAVAFDAPLVEGGRLRGGHGQHRDGRRLHRVGDQTRPRRQGHVQHPSRTRGADGPARLADPQCVRRLGTARVVHRMTSLPLVMQAPRRGKPPRHLLDLDLAARKQAVVELGSAPFRATQLSRQVLAPRRLRGPVHGPRGRRPGAVGALATPSC